jgi:hypothetical protein
MLQLGSFSCNPRQQRSSLGEVRFSKLPTRVVEDIERRPPRLCAIMPRSCEILKELMVATERVRPNERPHKDETGYQEQSMSRLQR